MKISRKKIALGTAALAIAAGVAVQMVWHPFGRAWKGQPRQLELDFSRPDALVDSESLSSLPRARARASRVNSVHAVGNGPIHRPEETHQLTLQRFQG